ncbi:Diaminopimelate epimerase-like protein [Decorospora gaudefroyi]|uniref:Diaminopimelate epimerase-like protein n=1 Tax=Decorospora gaudefroyi TaxID=184978 RepID=A0A6A5K047_9PLEO|nr:Diaminopimelate epimerase-like protein [Decorospora gaudefroyi]
MTSSSQLDFVTVDVFTSKPYEGNALAIVRIPPGRTLSQDQKQTIAGEFNLSETTFLHENGDDAKDDGWTVDIFMVSSELPFAGHPTIGTACYVLGRTAQARGIREGVMEGSFRLKAGRVGLRYDVARRTAKASVPHDVHVHQKRYRRDEVFALQPRLAEAHQRGGMTTREDFPIVSIVKGMTFVLVELESEEALGMVSLASRTLGVDGLDEEWNKTFIGSYFFVRIGKSEDGTTRLRSRMIEGPVEHPASGSAASDLAAYLSSTEGGDNKTLRYEIVQGVEMGRRSEIFIEVEMTDGGSVSKLYVEGGAVQVMEGRLTV